MYLTTEQRETLGRILDYMEYMVSRSSPYVKCTVDVNLIRNLLSDSTLAWEVTDLRIEAIKWAISTLEQCGSKLEDDMASKVLHGMLEEAREE